MAGFRLSLVEFLSILSSRGIGFRFLETGEAGQKPFHFLIVGETRILLSEIDDRDELASEVIEAYLDDLGLNHLREDFHLDPFPEDD